MKSYKHQTEAIERFKDSEFFALFCEMGTGKSRIAIKIAEHKFATGQIDAVLVIAPNHVHTQWIEEQFLQHCDIDYCFMVWSSSKRGGKHYENELDQFLTPKVKMLKVFTVNVEAFQSDSIIKYVAAFVKTNTPFIIIDEATRIKTPTAKRSMTIHRLEKYGQRCILTGTPVTKSPFGLWSMFEFLKSNFFGCNFFIFQARHGVMMQGVNQHTNQKYKTLIDEKTWNIVTNKIKKFKEIRGGLLMPDDYLEIAYTCNVTEKNIVYIERHEKYNKYKNLERLKEMIDPVTFYAKKEDCLDLPEKVYEVVRLEMDKEHKRIYKTLKTQLLAQYEGEELSVVNKMALTTRLMQICGGYFPYVVMLDNEEGEVEKQTKSKLIGKKNQKLERIKEELEETDLPVIIWAKYIAELRAIYDELKNDYKCVLYYGGTPSGERDQIIQDFKLGKYEVFIGNPAVAGFGLNLQNATTQFYFSNGFNVEERLQAEDRSHRLGVKNTCVYKDFVFKGSMDEKIMLAIKSGKDLNDYFRTQTLRELFDEGE